MSPDEYYFENQTVVAAYTSASCIGAGVVEAGETMSHADLVAMFTDSGIEAELVVLIKPSQCDEDLHTEDFEGSWKEVVDMLSTTPLYDLPAEIVIQYIPKYLH